MGAKGHARNHAPRARSTSDYIDLLQDALEAAVDNFIGTHGRDPDWSVVNVRGGTTTTDVVIEIEEVG